jgi:hypothetical protein
MTSPAQQRNAEFVGGTGTGKTRLAIAVARSCIRSGAPVAGSIAGATAKTRRSRGKKLDVDQRSNLAAG